ncbi:hypothetical protein K1719_000167 [Acacia pycnantha]|nr:hypothetical protein K1719_000167 [Acacia pycnantha]
MIGWAIELSEFDITYEARHAIKSQALADFVRELTPVDGDVGVLEPWKIYVDGSSNAKGSGARIIIESPEGVAMEHSLQLNFPTSNNQAEYEALLVGLQQAKELGAQRVSVFTDSQLVSAQVNGTYQAKGPLMAKYLNKVKQIQAEFEEVTVSHIPRGENVRADILSKLASTNGTANHRTVVQQKLEEPTCIMAISTATDWRKPIEDYLERGIVPLEKTEARKLIREAAVYTMVDDQLYRRGLHTPMLRCLGTSEIRYVLGEIHEGINGQHMGAKALARKALRAGYYWPTMEADAKEFVRTCDSCQKHAKIIWSPPSDMEYISAPWPFYKWGMDLLGPFKPAPGQLRWLIVAVDYFTKWIKAEPLATITSARDMTADLGITHHFASVEHPQSNGQAEAANKVILDGLKKKMQEADTSWVEQLYNVLWGIRTTTQSRTQETPFRMTYGCEAMIPVEIGQPSWRRLRVLEEGEGSNSRALATELELVDEVRTTAHCQDIATKQLMAAKYNRKVRPRAFDRGDLVLRRADVGNKNAKDGKLAANWDEPYRVKEKLDKGAYVLETLARKPVKRTWNADKLRVYYS